MERVLHRAAVMGSEGIENGCADFFPLCVEIQRTSAVSPGGEQRSLKDSVLSFRKGSVLILDIAFKTRSGASQDEQIVDACFDGHSITCARYYGRPLPARPRKCGGIDPRPEVLRRLHPNFGHVRIVVQKMLDQALRKLFDRS